MAYFGQAWYPHLISVIGGIYTCSHGISPGEAVIRINPQPMGNVPPLGKVTLTDGTNTVPVRTARFTGAQYVKDSSGEYMVLHFQDRRWLWRYGSITGCYNQRDPHGKLIPWMIRSPGELAALCLTAMGEQKAKIDMPPGLTSASGANINAFLGLGENFPPTGLNPPINWNGELPAMALQQLCDMMGRIIVYDPIGDNVYITVKGIGKSLPSSIRHSQRMVAPSVTVSPAPSVLVCRGAATRYQGKYRLEAVGLEWDGSYRPIDQLSYTPIVPAQPKIVKVTFSWTPPIAGLNAVLSITINGTVYDWTSTNVGAGTATAAAADFASQITASAAPDIKNNILATSSGGVLTIKGVGNAVDFQVACDFSPGGGFAGMPDGTSIKVQIVQEAADETRSWKFCEPPLFPTVEPVVDPLNPQITLLTEAQARQLAQQSVFKYYRVVNLDVGGIGGINIPGYGRLLRREQLILLDTKVKQIVPQKGDENFVDPITGEPLIVNMFSGYSRDQQAEVTGSIAISITGEIIGSALDQDDNTPEGSHVFVDFSIDPEWQLVKFGSHVFRYGDNGSIEEPFLILETGCNVRNPITNQIECYTSALRIQQGVVVSEIHREDVQLNVYGIYDGPTKTHLKEARILEADALGRAAFYLGTWALQYQQPNALTIEYNGTLPINLDGAISQITWQVGGGQDATTTASRNSEHAAWLRPAGERRRAEFLGQGQLESLVRLNDRINESRITAWQPAKGQS